MSPLNSINTISLVDCKFHEEFSAVNDNNCQTNDRLTTSANRPQDHAFSMSVVSLRARIDVLYSGTIAWTHNPSKLHAAVAQGWYLSFLVTHTWSCDKWCMHPVLFARTQLIFPAQRSKIRQIQKSNNKDHGPFQPQLLDRTSTAICCFLRSVNTNTVPYARASSSYSLRALIMSLTFI